MPVPNTTTFSLQDVVNVVNPTSNDLLQCFADAKSDYFNPTYYDTGNDLLEFRDYGSHNSNLTDKTINVNPNFVAASVGTNIENVTVTTEPTSGTWHIASSPTWILATKDSVNVMRLEIQSNSGSPRIGYVTVAHDGDSSITASVRIEQEGNV